MKRTASAEQQKHPEFTEISISLTSRLTKQEKKDGGIFFTPRTIVNKALDSAISAWATHQLQQPPIINILEPSCGSGEFIEAVRTNPVLGQHTNITGVEFNSTIYGEIIKKYPQTQINSPSPASGAGSIKLFNADFLAWTPPTTTTTGTASTPVKYDLIVGNPPYFTMKKSDVKKEYYQYFDGRPNIYIIFIIKCMNMLNPGGVLSFVLPSNFLNSVYYNKLRQFISNPANNFQICHIINCSAENFYIDTEQNTIIFTIKYLGAAVIDNSRFMASIKFRDDELVIWNTPAAITVIRDSLVGAVSLDSLGFEVSVGSVVWNQHKPKLTDDPTAALLIYNSNLVAGRLEIQQFKKAEKKNYIRMPADVQTPMTGPILLVNRGYGVGAYSFDYYYGNPGRPYFVENHLIVIRPKSEEDTIKNPGAVLKKYRQITDSFNNPKTAQFTKNYFSNNAINTTELQYILPIYFIAE